MSSRTKSPKARAAELRQRLNEASSAYYVEDEPIMSDAEFDRLFGTLARTTDPDEARRLAEEIDQYCFEQSKALFLCAPQALYAVNRHVDFKAYRATFELADTAVDPAHWSRRNEEEPAAQ